MRLCLPIGAVLPLLLAALAARTEDPVADPGRVRISYEQRTWIDAGASGGEGEHLRLAAMLLADWTVKSADEKKLVLRARVGEARLECERGDGSLESSAVGSRRCHAVARPCEIEVILTRSGAVLEGDILSLLRAAEIHQQGSGRASRSLPAYALEPFRKAITSAVFEAFVHLLPPAREGPVDTRRFEVRTEGGRDAGTFELSFPAAERWEGGDLSWASGTLRFTPPRGKPVELPDRPARLTWSHRGRRRDDWMAKLEHPGSNPQPTALDTRRRIIVEPRFSARWLGDPADVPEAALERVQLAPGQKFLFELSSQEELRASAAGSASRSWHEATGVLALVVAEAPPPPGKVRFEGLFLAGRLREANVAGISEARVLDPASLQVVPSLGGVEVEVEAGPEGVAVTVDDVSWRRALAGGVAKDPRRDAALRTALSRAAAVCLRSTLADVATAASLWSASLVDGRGKDAGEVLLAADLASLNSSRYRLEGRQVESRSFRLEAKWPVSLASPSPPGGDSRPRFSQVFDALLPVPVEADLWIGLDARDPKSPPTVLSSVRIHAQISVKARQIGGPRYRPLPPAPEAAAAPPAAVPPADTSPLPPPELAAAAPPAVQAKVEAIFADLPAGWDGVETALERYARLEAEEPRSHAAAAAHAEIVLRLRDRIDGAALPPLARHLEPSAAFAVRILAMRLVAHAPELDDPKRAATIAPLLSDIDRYTVIFAGHFLGWIRDPASVEALIARLESLEAQVGPGNPEPIGDRELRLSLAADLYRLLGEGASRTAAAGFRDLWQRRGKKLPADPFAPGTPTSVTMARAYRTFSDVRSAPIVFLLDASSSMTDPVPASGIPLPPGVNAGSGLLEKLEWARGDLGAILADLEPGSRFQVIAFNKTTRSLGGSLATVPKASPGTKASLGAARSFLKSVKSQRGTNIHAAFEKAFQLPEVGAICLLSDGHPTAGPGADDIDRDVFRWGYLRGVRIVAASFTGDIAQPDNLCSLLARRWFGWVRALDAGAVAPPPPPAAPPAMVDDDD